MVRWLFGNRESLWIGYEISPVLGEIVNAFMQARVCIDVFAASLFLENEAEQ